MPIFSTPLVIHSGQETGHAEHGDNTRTLMEVKHYIAAYREEQGYSSPTVITNSISNVTSNSATSGGSIENDGGSDVTSKGLVYGTTENPTTSNNVINAGEGNESFVMEITDLYPATDYYVRAFAVNQSGLSYGNLVHFYNRSGYPNCYYR